MIATIYRCDRRITPSILHATRIATIETDAPEESLSELDGDFFELESNPHGDDTHE